MSTSTKPNIVVIGGSYVGANFVDRIAPEVFETHHTVLLEKNSHFHHLFAFPRFAAVPLPPNKTLIPYTNAFHAAPPGSTSIVHGIAAQVLPDKVVLQSGEAIPYEYLVLATGTGFVPVSSRTKTESVAIGKAIQERVRESERVVVVGGGAYGVQLATDAKEHYPSKRVTLIHSREQLMNRFHPELHNVMMKTLDAAGIEVILGQRVKVPEGGHFPLSGPSYNVELADGRLIPADVAISCIGAVPLSGPIESLSPALIDESKFVRVKSTLQVEDDRYPNVFAIGDVAATGANKNARSGSAQAEVAAANIKSLINGGSATQEYAPSPLAIHMSTGLWSWILFRNPASPDAQPTVEYQDLSGQKGTLQGEVSMLMGCDRLWALRAPGVTDYDL
ncbi:FAD/NAD-P-binding domain-containing protein [Mycena albidolilacea]|uniref:FAD/NAD-P-binding domain-containing protein n=1 Tax=Mycena albidolilacea TaxID=1033008 RepID=A0AAD7AV87_9AGAR|nr:FAD/NAD-P-binding domain-containing protein [Mycena albidolilacea]